MNRISRLLYDRFLKRLSPDDETVLEQWKDADPRHADLWRRVADPAALDEEYRFRLLVNSERAETDMLNRIRIAEAPRRRRRRLIAGITSAAAVAALCLWWFAPASPDLSPADIKVAAISNIDDIKPGVTKAIVTSPGGMAIELNSDDDGQSVELLAADHPRASAGQVTKVSNLRLDVPRGAEFCVLLEDSTRVWLNSASTLSYPESFGANERRVRVTGEAYFMVTRDESRPFYVEAGDQLIRVYGTSFNVRDYDDDGVVYTTLEKGSISLSRLSGETGEVFIRPGQQSVFAPDASELVIRAVDPEVIGGWRHGRFVFEEQPLSAIMRDLSRWYDFEYEFADEEIADIVFMGSIPRYADFATAAQILENSGAVQFEIASSKVIISKNQ